MRKLFALLVLTASLTPSVHAQERRPEVARYTMAYSGGEGYQIWVTRLGAKENQEALVQISGIDHKLDGRVLRAKATPGGNGSSVKYTASVDGQSYELLSVEGTKAVLRITGAPWSSDLCYDKSLVTERPPQHLLTDYLEGAQAKK